MNVARLGFAGALLLFASSAAGAPTTAPTEEKKEATALFTEGTRLMDRGDYEHARLKFLAVSALVKSPHNLFNLGFCEVRSEHYVEGLRHLRQYLREPNTDPPQVKQANDELIPQAVAHDGQLQIDLPVGSFVTLDGTDSIGQAPFPDPVAVAPGKHHVEGQLGTEKRAFDIEVKAGETVRVPVTSSPAPTAPSTIEHESQPSPVVTPPTEPAEQPPTTHTRANPLRLGLTVGFGVAAVAAFATGAYFGVQSSNNAATVAQSTLPNNACVNSAAAGCSALHSAVVAQNTDETVSIVTYSVAGAFAVGAVLSWVLLPKTTTDERPMATPLVGPGLVGAQWSAHF